MRCWVKTRKNRFRAPQKKGGKTELMTRLIGFCATKRREMAPSNTKRGELFSIHTQLYIYCNDAASKCRAGCGDVIACCDVT